MLSRLLENDKQIKEVKINKNAPGITHLMYADDLIVACRANPKNAVDVARCLNQYYDWSGQLINARKSSIFFLKNTSLHEKRKIKATLGILEIKPGPIYLGNTFIKGRSKIKDFGRLTNKVQARLDNWQSQLFSQASRATLIKYVLQSIPIYSMTTYKIPKTLCSKLDAIAMRFWLGVKANQKHFIAWKSWDHLCKHQEAGELASKGFLTSTLGCFPNWDGRWKKGRIACGLINSGKNI